MRGCLFLAGVLAASNVNGAPPEGAKLLPNVTSRWEGELVQDFDPINRAGADKGAGQVISFTISTNASAEPTAVNVSTTARTAVVTEADITCFAGGLVGGAASASPPFIFPSGDGFAATGSRAVAGDPLTAVGFGMQIEVGEVQGFGTVGENQAIGSVQYTYTHDVEGEGTRMSPCNWTFEAMCVENCTGGGLFSFAVASIEVRETVGMVEITVQRTAASMGEVMVDFATSDGTATAGEDYTAQSGTLTFADGETSMTFSVPIAVNMPFEGPETIMLTLSNPQGGAELGATTTAEIIIDDRPDLSIDPFTVSSTDIEEAGGRFLIRDLMITVRNNAEDGEDVDSARLDVIDNASFTFMADVGPLAPGASETVTFDYDATSAISAADGMGPFTVMAEVDAPDAIPETNEANNTAEDDSSIDVRPMITAVDPMFTIDGHFFLENRPVNNPIMVAVDWNGELDGLGVAPFGTVTFDLNGGQTVVPGSMSGATQAYDMGSDFFVDVGCDQNSLIIFAEQGGFMSPPTPMTSASTTVFSYPDWVDWVINNIPGAATDFMVMPAAPIVNYEYNFMYPEEPFEAILPVPEGVPYFGGNMLGILPTSAMVKATAASSGMSTLRLTGTSGLAVGVGQVVGIVFGEGQLQYDCLDGLDLTAAVFGLDITAQITREQGLVEVFPGIAVAQTWPVVGELIEWLTETATVSGAIGPRIAVEATFRPDATGALRFDQSQVEGALPTSATLALQPLEDILLTVTGGGEPFVLMNFPANPDYLEQIGIRLMVMAELDVYGFGGEFEQGVNCTLPGGCMIAKGMGQGLGKGPLMAPVLLPRDYFGPDYAQFDGAAVDNPMLRAPDRETRLVANAFPRLTNSLAPGVGSTRFWMAATHDDPADGAGRGTEIYTYALADGVWSGPMPVTSDEQGDFAPAIAVDADGDPVVIWERSTLATGTTPELTQAYAQTFEIYWSTFTDGAWTVPTALTSNALMDQAPKLVRQDDGSLLAVWRTHSGSDITGSMADPVTLRYAIWNGDSWSAPAPAVSGLVDVLQVALAAGNGEAALVFTQRRATSGKGFDASQVDLAYATFNGAIWSAAQALTSDQVADNGPALVYDAQGDRHLLWVRNDALVWLENDWDPNNAMTLDASSADAGYLGLRAAADASGNLALVYQSVEGSGNNLAYRRYEHALGGWGEPVMLGSDAAIEGRHSAAFDASGTLGIAYAKTAITLVDTMVDDGVNPSFMVENMPQAGATDLIFFERASGADLAMSALTIAPPDALGGEAFTADVVLVNQGDATETAALVVTLDGVELARVSQGLAPGESLTTQVSGTVAQSGSTLIAIADPDAALTEVNEDNNRIEEVLGGTLPEEVFADGFETTVVVR